MGEVADPAVGEKTPTTTIRTMVGTRERKKTFSEYPSGALEGFAP